LDRPLGDLETLASQRGFGLNPLLSDSIENFDMMAEAVSALLD